MMELNKPPSPRKAGWVTYVRLYKEEAMMAAGAIGFPSYNATAAQIISHQHPTTEKLLCAPLPSVGLLLLLLLMVDAAVGLRQPRFLLRFVEVRNDSRKRAQLTLPIYDPARL